MSRDEFSDESHRQDLEYVSRRPAESHSETVQKWDSLEDPVDWSDVPIETEDYYPKILGRNPKAPLGMKAFTVVRKNDQSGVSGTGPIAQGVLFATGRVALHWLTPFPRGDLQIKDSMQQFLDVHVTPHPENKTEIWWQDGHIDYYPPKDQTPKEDPEED